MFSFANLDNYSSMCGFSFLNKSNSHVFIYLVIEEDKVSTCQQQQGGFSVPLGRRVAEQGVVSTEFCSLTAVTWGPDAEVNSNLVISFTESKNGSFEGIIIVGC